MQIETILYIILALIAALAIAVFQYFYKSKTKSKAIILLTFLRFLGIFSLLLLLINPKFESRILETVKPKLVVAVDNSSSIKELNSEEGVRKFIRDIKNNTALSEKFDIDFFSFADDITPLDSLHFSKNSTNISQSLSSLDNLYKEKATLLLVTDGNQTIGSDYSFYRSKSKLFPIVVGDTTKYDDLKIYKLNVNKYTFLGNNFPVELFVNYDGNESINSVLTIKKSNGIVFKKNISLNALKNSEKVNFNLPASKIGITNYSAFITHLKNEKNTINNVKNFTVEVIDEQSKIALISDIIHPDLGMLKRSIETNKQRKVELLSPNSSIKLNDYQLVILYQPNTNFKTVFEKIEDKKINSFIITGTQTDWQFLNRAQKNFRKDAISSTEDYLATFNTNYGAFVVDELSVDNLSPLQDYFGDIKFNIPNETMLFQNIGGFETENPLLATYSSNNRRGAVLFGENSWQWRALSFVQQKSFTNFDAFINKLIQYLASSKKFSRVELNYTPIVYQNDEVKIAASYLDANYVIDTRAELVLNLKNLTTNVIKQYPLRLHKNSFETTLSNLKSGNYSFIVKVKGQNITRSGNFTVLDYNIEQQFTYANTVALQKLASNSNGQLVFEDKSAKLIEQLVVDNNYKSIQKSTKKIISLVDWKWLLGFIVFIFSLEWSIRKYGGLI